MYRYFTFISFFLFSLFFYSCNTTYSDSENVIGSWQRTDSLGTYTLIFHSDNTFTENLDNYVVDPNSWDGTYSLIDNQLSMQITNSFSGTTENKISTISIVSNTLTMEYNNGPTFSYKRTS